MKDRRQTVHVNVVLPVKADSDAVARALVKDWVTQAMDQVGVIPGMNSDPVVTTVDQRVPGTDPGGYGFTLALRYVGVGNDPVRAAKKVQDFVDSVAHLAECFHLHLGVVVEE